MNTASSTPAKMWHPALYFSFMTAHWQSRAHTWKAHGHFLLFDTFWARGRRENGKDLGFDILYHKSGLKKWWFSDDRFISSVWSVTHDARPRGWQMSENECVLFGSVCSLDEVVWWDRLERRTESRMCETCWEVFFSLIGFWPKSKSASLHSTCSISGKRYFNTFGIYETQYYLCSLIKRGLLAFCNERNVLVLKWDLNTHDSALKTSKWHFHNAG